MSYTYDPFWQQRIADTFSCALNAYTRLLALRVDLRLPDTPAASDTAVISRFTDSLKAELQPFRRVNVARANASGRPRCVLSGRGSLVKSKGRSITTRCCC